MKPQLVSILNMFSTLCYSLDPAINGEEDDDEDETSEGVSMAAESDKSVSSPTRAQRKPTEPLIPIVEKILPTLVTVAEKWAKDDTVMESLLGIVKHTLSSLHLSSSPVLHHSIQLVIISFKSNPIGVTVNLTKQVETLFDFNSFTRMISDDDV